MSSTTLTCHYRPWTCALYLSPQPSTSRARHQGLALTRRRLLAEHQTLQQRTQRGVHVVVTVVVVRWALKAGAPRADVCFVMRSCC
eukprot:879689-Prorocentrum_minimum.AAC.1